MRKLTASLIACLLVLGGCAPSFDRENEVVQETDDSQEKAVIPSVQISDQYYRTITPFRPSASRGLIAANLNTQYDIEEFERGLMRIAQESFSPERFLFQEGQYLDRDTIRSWLARKKTEKQLAEEKMTEDQNLGLNPVLQGDPTNDEVQEDSPLYLAHILEHNYLVQKEDSLELGGLVIGLALNTTHYYQKEQFGATYEVNLADRDKQVEEQGKKMAQQILNRIRAREDLQEVPVTIALFKQRPKHSVTPGNFVSFTEVEKGSNNIGSWKKWNEKYMLFPSDAAQRDHRDDYMRFLNFKQDIDEYYPNYNGVVGRGLYQGEQLNRLTIDIPIQFYGQAETIGFTQYVTGLVTEHFPEYLHVEVNISSVSGAESLVVKEANAQEPYVHIYR
ncbi:CamS family sex pheromone protein [Mangrovibacillus cuniculi]|uniref:CamS family sex pheromone protein n=1 Tax=Mangrovibacillus cuniculi TaxID=2593652 RepID=A0A7S8HEH3_9BACI|nr:CamS family sex pheromone protein [Mangrovibacillus cuniculi]QPC45501.1 CamS family sex pheromone protein [Mangrovibacillus cuniculi]